MSVVVPTSHDFPDGISTSSELNAFVRDPLNFLLNRPMGIFRQTVAQTVTTATNTALLFDEEIFDPLDGHSTSTNTSRYYAKYAGWYQISGGSGWASNTTNRRGCRWAVNGVSVNGSGAYQSANPTGTCEVPSRTLFVKLNIGDYVELHGYQDTGGDLLTAVTTDTYSTMAITWVSRVAS